MRHVSGERVRLGESEFTHLPPLQCNLPPSQCICRPCQRVVDCSNPYPINVSCLHFLIYCDDVDTIFHSGPTEIGMSRLSLSDTDKEARDWFERTTKALGCTVTTDQMGNQFAVRPGRKDGPPTFAGSHMDTQPTVREH